jgi:peptide deformylase
MASSAIRASKAIVRDMDDRISESRGVVLAAVMLGVSDL